MTQKLSPHLNPPWLHLLNALQKEWRTGELLKDRNPDPFLEDQLRAQGAWPPPPDYLTSREMRRNAQ